MSRQPEKKPRAERFGMPPLANLYDLSTWQAERTGPRAGRPEPQDQDRRRSERHVQASARTERTGPATSGDGRGAPSSFSRAVPGAGGPHAPMHSPDTGRLDGDKEPETESGAVDPVDQPTTADAHEQT